MRSEDSGIGSPPPESSESPVLSPEQAHHVVERVLGLVAADDAVLRLNHLRQSTVRFSGNAIAQSIHQDRLTFSLTVFFGQRKGTAQVDAVDDDSLRSLVRRAEEVARLAPPDPEYLPSLGPQDYPSVTAFSPETARLPEREIAEAARRMIAPAAAAGLRASGTVEASVEASGVATKNGLFAFHIESRGEAGCTVATPDSTGWARDAALGIEELRPEQLAEQAVATALRARSPRSVAPGRYPTLFLPAAVNHLVSILPWQASARYTLDGLTYLSGKEDLHLASDLVTLRSDPADPRFPSCPFDEEGVPRRRVVWIDRGDFRQMWWERWTAREHGVDAVPPPGPGFMDGSEQPVDDLIRGIERGVLVTRFWYVRFVKPDQTLVTGMTRDGTFWIEDGKVQHPLRNLRFNDTCLGMVQRVAAIGRPERCVSVETGPGFFPPLVVEGWNFVESTEF